MHQGASEATTRRPLYRCQRLSHWQKRLRPTKRRRPGLQGKEKGTHIGTFAERTDRYRGLACGKPTPSCDYDVTRIKRMLNAAAKPAASPASAKDGSGGKLVQRTLPRFARSDEHFARGTSSYGASISLDDFAEAKR